MSRQIWKPGTMLNPVPVVMITCENEGVKNVFTVDKRGLAAMTASVSAASAAWARARGLAYPEGWGRALVSAAALASRRGHYARASAWAAQSDSGWASAAASEWALGKASDCWCFPLACRPERAWARRDFPEETDCSAAYCRCYPARRRCRAWDQRGASQSRGSKPPPMRAPAAG